MIGWDPEAIELALFNFLQGVVSDFPFRTVSRHPRIWPNVAPADQPAFYLAPLGWHATQDATFGAPKYVNHFLALVYTRADANMSPTNPIAPQTFLNQCALAIINALLGKPTDPVQAAQWIPHGEKLTLGGLVENCWHDGEATMQPGILDPQCALELPIHTVTGA